MGNLKGNPKPLLNDSQGPAPYPQLWELPWPSFVQGGNPPSNNQPKLPTAQKLPVFLTLFTSTKVPTQSWTSETECERGLLMILLTQESNILPLHDLSPLIKGYSYWLNVAWLYVPSGCDKDCLLWSKLGSSPSESSAWLGWPWGSVCVLAESSLSKNTAKWVS